MIKHTLIYQFTVGLMRSFGIRFIGYYDINEADASDTPTVVYIRWSENRFSALIPTRER